MKTCIITGASSGLGLAIAEALSSTGQWDVINIDKDVLQVSDDDGHLISARANITTMKVDLESSEEIQRFCADWPGDTPVDCLINNVGINRIAMLEDFTEEWWDRLMSVNTKSIYLMSQGMLPHLKAARESRGWAAICNIVSNAAHMPMTSSLCYNATKGAAHIMTKQLARELTKRWDITVMGIAPNRMSGTQMSDYINEAVCETRGWTPEQAQEYQRQSLLAGDETPPWVVADLLAYLMGDPVRTRFLTGCIIPYGV